MSRIISIALACLVLFAAFLTAQAAYDPILGSEPLTDAQLRDHFGAFITKFGRNYSTDLEYETRFQVFAANVREAQQMTLESKTATFGITKFSDWTPQERKTFLGKLPAGRTKHAVAPRVSVPANATSFDLRKLDVVPPVKDQGSCGSCWAFSTVFGAESAALKAGLYTEPLSQQQVVSCCTPRSQCAGCNGGDLPVAVDYLETFGGLQTAKSYPYTAKDGVCQHNKADIAVAVKGFEWIIPTCDGEDCRAVDSQTFLSRLQTKGQSGAICVAATNAWFSYTGGVFDQASCTGQYYELNHCVGGIVEYNAEEGYVSIQNSWGEDWGVDGLMKLKYDPKDPKFNNLCGIFSEGVFVDVAKP